MLTHTHNPHTLLPLRMDLDCHAGTGLRGTAHCALGSFWLQWRVWTQKCACASRHPTPKTFRTKCCRQAGLVGGQWSAVGMGCGLVGVPQLHMPTRQPCCVRWCCPPRCLRECAPDICGAPPPAQAAAHARSRSPLHHRLPHIYTRQLRSTQTCAISFICPHSLAAPRPWSACSAVTLRKLTCNWWSMCGRHCLVWRCPLT